MLVCVIFEEGADSAFSKFDAVLAFGSEPAAVEAFGRDNNIVVFTGYKIEILPYAFLRQTPDNAGRNEEDHSQCDQQRHEPSIHSKSPFAAIDPDDASTAPVFGPALEVRPGRRWNSLSSAITIARLPFSGQRLVNKSNQVARITELENDISAIGTESIRPRRTRQSTG